MTDPAPPVTDEGTEEAANRLRAGVLGAIDGLTSVGGVIVGLAATTATTSTIAYVGLLALFTGAVSMGSGEYASVAEARDVQAASGETDLPSPWGAAITSGLSFACGAAAPTLAGIAPQGVRVALVVAAVLAGLVVTGVVSARAGRLPAPLVRRAVARTLIGGCVGMAAGSALAAMS